MNLQTTQENQITEFNKKTLINASAFCREINTDPEKGKSLQLNLEFHNYSDLGFNIESLLNAVNNADEKNIKNDPIMYQNITLLATQLIGKIPLEFIDKLLIKESYNAKDFLKLDSI